jgi:hypothetical protein
MIVLDELPTDSLLGGDGRIDATRFPNFARLAAGSDWFPNATTVGDWTWRALPAMLTGTNPRHRRWTADGGRSTIFRLLSERGYALHSLEEVTRVCRYRACRHLAGRGLFGNLGQGRMERLDATIASIRRTRRPTFTFHHTPLPHQPWVYLPSGRRYEQGLGDFRRGVSGPPGFHDPFLTLHNEQRYLLQLGAVDLALGRLLQRLRATRLYDQSLIIVTADHGIAFDLNVPDRRKVTPGNIDEIAPVPLFMKFPRQRTGRVDRSYARTVDIVPTVARLLRIRIPWRVDGRPVWDRSVRRRRTVSVVKRSLRGWVTVGAGTLQRARVANTRARIQRLGSAPWTGGVFSIGPHRELLGSSPTALRAAGRSHLRVQLTAGRGARQVDSRSGFIPALVAGRIVGGAPRAERDLAVVVNSRVSAVGRSFHLRGRPDERFSMVVPEGAFREGSNDVAVLEVKGGQLVRLPFGH